MMRDMVISDLVHLETKAQFPIEFLLNKPKIVQKTFEDEEGLIGSIIVTGTAELSAIFDDRSPRDKVEVMMQLTDILYRELAPKGYRDLHTFVKDPRFANILVKHFGFRDTSGRALVRSF